MAERSVRDAGAIKWWKALAGQGPAPVVVHQNKFVVSAHQTLVLSVVAAVAGLALGAFLLFQ